MTRVTWRGFVAARGRRLEAQLLGILLALSATVPAVAQPAGDPPADDDDRPQPAGPLVLGDAEKVRERSAYLAIAKQIQRERDNPGADLDPPYLSQEAPANALQLPTVLVSARRFYPGLIAARAKLEAAAADRVKALGGFDLKVVGKGGYNPLGKYREGRFSVGLEQPTTMWGTRLYTRYRNGFDLDGLDFPVYKSQYATSGLGEAALGAVVPLWQGGPIDERRLELQLAELGVSVAKADLRMKRVMLRFDAAAAYWKWVAEGRNAHIAEALLRIAQDRDRGLTDQVRRGALPAVTIADNVRLIATREVRAIEARRKLRQAAIKLAMYYRDRRGHMVVARRKNLPADFPTPTKPPARLQADAMRTALGRRPELLALRLAVQRQRARLRYGRNKRGPKLDLGVEVSQDFGAKQRYVPFAETSNDTKLALTLSVKWPVQQRKGRGIEAKALAKLRGLSAEQHFMRDRVRGQVLGALVDLRAAYRESINAKKAYLAAYRMEVAERERFNQGRSDLLYVNVREDKTAEAAAKYVKALKNYHIARAQFRAVQGLL